MSNEITPSHENWTNCTDDCLLCDMEQRTEWHYEDDTVVIADTLGSGHPFAVLKRHTTEPTQDERAHIERIVELLFGEADLDVRMNLVPSHFHCHIVQLGAESPPDLSDE